MGIHYEVVNICTGDMGTVASKKYDLEAWLPVLSSTKRSFLAQTALIIRQIGFKLGMESQATPSNRLHIHLTQRQLLQVGHW